MISQDKDLCFEQLQQVHINRLAPCLYLGKTLRELIEPCPVRISAVRDFLRDIRPQLDYYIVPITDPYGPAIVEPGLECIVVSEETLGGGNKINEIRAEKVSVDLCRLLKSNG